MPTQGQTEIEIPMGASSYVTPLVGPEPYNHNIPPPALDAISQYKGVKGMNKAGLLALSGCYHII